MAKIKTIIDLVWNNGMICIAVAAGIYSLAGALIRPLSPFISVPQIVATRSALSLFYSYIIYHAMYNKNSTTIPPNFFGNRQNMLFLGIRGLVGALAMDCYYQAIRYLPFSDAVSLMFINPSITAIFAWIFLKESLKLLGVFGILSSLLGMLFVVQPPGIFAHFVLIHDSNSHSTLNIWTTDRAIGVAYGTASAFLAAAAYLSIRIIGRKESSLTVAIWFHTTALIHSLLLLLFKFAFYFSPSSEDWMYLVFISISSFASNILLNRGFMIETAALASSVNYSQVVYAHIIGMVLFHERITLLGILGALLIAIGVFCISHGRNMTSTSNNRDADIGNDEKKILLSNIEQGASTSL